MDYEKKLRETLHDETADYEVVRWIEREFPGLRESEDDRIRTALCDIVRDMPYMETELRAHGLTVEKTLAYLEKQKINTDGDFARGYDCGYECCLNSHGAEWLEKQKDNKFAPRVLPCSAAWFEDGEEKQKEPHYTKRNALFDKCVENCDPKTVEEVNKRVDDIINMPELSAFEQALTNFIGYWEDDEERWPSKFVKKHSKHILDMAREELQKEQKPAEWNANDRAFIKDCARILDENGYTASAERLLSMFPVKPAEWSEEDKRKLNRIYEILGYAADDKGFLTSKRIIGDKEAIELQDFLKSLRPSWKPSEEQMESLNKVRTLNPGLDALYQQLKNM